MHRQLDLFQEPQPKPTAQPFFAWVGGKRLLLPEILPHIPSKINRYYEPFIGGGALMWALARDVDSVINDLNPEITDAYKCVKSSTSLNELIQILEDLTDEYNHLSTTEKRKSEFLKIRAEDRTPDYKSWPIEYRTARFLFLNRTAFNSVYRLNRKGYFNTSFGTDRILNFDFENLRACHDILQNVEIRNMSFDSACRDAQEGDFVYLDPPYDPISSTANFVGYTGSDFGKKEQQDVYDLCVHLDSKNVKFMLSNSSTEFIHTLYRKFNIRLVSMNRLLNVDASKRGAVNEVLITNY